MAAELTALMPLEGGFYYWVREALGPFAGFVEAYLTLLYTATDMAIYPVLIAAYLGFVFPLGTAAQIAVGIALVWLSGALNILGVRPVGNTSIVLMVAILAPFAAMVIVGFPRLVHWQLAGATIPMAATCSARSAARSRSSSGISADGKTSAWSPAKSKTRGATTPARSRFALPLVTIGYLLPLAVSLSGASSTAAWRLGYFVEVGRSLGGPLLAMALVAGGAISAFSIFDAAMLWVSRMPYVLAREGYLPRAPRAYLGRSRDARHLDRGLLRGLFAARAAGLRRTGRARRVLLHGRAGARDVGAGHACGDRVPIARACSLSAADAPR